MVKFTSVAILLSGQAAAFSTIKIKTSRANRLYYKDPQDDSFGYQKLPTNGTIIYNDFEIRESESIPSSTDANLPLAVEPADKPAKKFLSPIQMIKLVPKVTPVSNSTVFFVAPVLEKPETAPQIVDTPPPANKMKSTWTTRSKFGTTAFQSTNYLESLSPSSNTKEEEENKSFHASLRNQKGILRDERLRSTQEAMQEATRRTNPQEAFWNRIEKAEELRKQREIEHLEKAYDEKMQRLEDKKRLERESKLTRERYAEERRRVDAVKKEAEIARAESELQIKRGVPVLTPFLRKSQSTPLLIGSTITLQYENMTPFQIKTLEVAQSLHEEHCSKMTEDNSTAGKEGGIEAAPIVAIIDQYTREVDTSDNKRFATLASVEVVSDKYGEPVAVNLMGVGRVFLHSYFSSRDAGLIKEEAELNNLLDRMYYLTETEEVDLKDEEEQEDDDFPVVMAEFDLVLDDSSILIKATKHQDATKERASSVHAVTELYRTANKVYRLHEERKRLLSGLRAGQARLNFRETENEVIEYDDWSDDDGGTESMFEHYGFGTYGIFSTIPDLTRELLASLQPYYSSAHREREEYEAEVASFVALRVLEHHASPSELSAALMAPSATERLYMAYGLMSRHRDELLVLVKKMNEDLTECGEECSDLW